MSILGRLLLTRIHARQDSIDRPWPIDPTSEAVFGELDGELSLPMRIAEAFGFGRENQNGEGARKGKKVARATHTRRVD